MSDLDEQEALELRQKLGIEVFPHAPTGALVKMGAIPQDLSELLKELPAEPREFIETFRRKLTITATAQALGFKDRNKHYYWLKTSPFKDTYTAAWRIAEEEVTDALEATLVERCLDGQREEIYGVDSEGNEKLKAVKVKHDAAYLKMALAARKPEVYGREGGAGSINIIVQVVNE